MIKIQMIWTILFSRRKIYFCSSWVTCIYEEVNDICNDTIDNTKNYNNSNTENFDTDVDTVDDDVALNSNDDDNSTNNSDDDQTLMTLIIQQLIH